LDKWYLISFKLSKNSKTLLNLSFVINLICIRKYNLINNINLVLILIPEVRKNTDTPVVYYVVGNKTDLLDSRTIMYEEGEEFANSVNAHYWETSVYSNTGEI